VRLTDHQGWRITCFATNTRGPCWTLPALEVRHCQRARCEDRIRALKDTGLAEPALPRRLRQCRWPRGARGCGAFGPPTETTLIADDAQSGPS